MNDAEIYDPVIRVDKTKPVKYPDWGKPLYPNLELAGPDSFNINQLVQYPRQGSGEEIHEELIVRNLIKSCFGLLEFIAILNRRGPGLFLKHFGDQKTIYGFRSIVKSVDTNVILVPHISYDPEVDGGDVILGWDRLDWITISTDSLLLFFHNSK